MYYCFLDIPDQINFLRDAFPNTSESFIDDRIFYSIPNKERYKINKIGCIFDTVQLIVLPQTVNKTGYPAVTLRDDKKARGVTCHIHRLLAITFIPTNDKGDIKDLQVNHKDGNKINYHLSNLEWVTAQENCDHAYRNNLRTDNTPIKITDIDSDTVTIVHSLGEAGRLFNVSPATILYYVRCGKSFKHHFFEYATKENKNTRSS